MDKIILSDYFPNSLQDSQKELEQKLINLHHKYPCANTLNLLYLKLLQQNNSKEYDRNKAKLLLGIYNKHRFHQFQLGQKPSAIDKLLKSTDVDSQHAQEENSGPVSQETKSNVDEILPVENQLVQEPAAETKEQTHVIDSLIEKFSNDPPTIKKTPINHDPLANYSEGSLIEDEEIVSKTLAIIYADQGYTGKAIKMLKKLSLIYPEKSSIFAAQIERIKNEKNNNQEN
ncbi:MAG: hypothetical protein MJZ72_06300 [Bacteroidales bacterium]|nr:hypothetical protein [Bacteroidales bacterium]